jgi:ABC-type multidrug transport system ATPase subunit
MRFDGLPVVVLQQIRIRALEGARRTTGEGRGVTTAFTAGAVGLLGPNGAGKSTMIKALLGFVVPNLSPSVRRLLSYFSSVEHMYEFNRGIISTRPVVYYLSGALLLQFLTHAVLQFRRWRL